MKTVDCTDTTVCKSKEYKCDVDNQNFCTKTNTADPTDPADDGNKIGGLMLILICCIIALVVIGSCAIIIKYCCCKKKSIPPNDDIGNLLADNVNEKQAMLPKSDVAPIMKSQIQAPKP